MAANTGLTQNQRIDLLQKRWRQAGSWVYHIEELREFAIAVSPFDTRAFARPGSILRRARQIPLLLLHAMAADERTVQMLDEGRSHRGAGAARRRRYANRRHGLR